MFTIRKKFKFEMSHRLVSCYSEGCKNIHGHSYILEVFFTSNTLNKDGMVLDFGEIKNNIIDYINSWDHALILYKNDNWSSYMQNSDLKYKLLDYNPTAENMCREMYNYIKHIYPQLSKVRLHETTTGWAEYTE